MKRIVAVLFLITLSFTATAQNDPQALYKLGQDAMTHGEPAKAVEYFEKLVALKPTNADYQYQLGVAYAQAGTNAGMFGGLSMMKSMKASFEKAIQLDPNLIVARFGLLEFHLNAPSMFGSSEAGALEQATAIRKRDAIEGHRAFARIQTKASKQDLARKEYVDMLREQPASARAHYYYGVYLMITEKNYKAASEELE